VEEEYDSTHGHEQVSAPLQSFLIEIKIIKVEITRNKNELYEHIHIPLQHSVL
jgi:tRNA A37 methylthiotransferase MiaB